MIVENLGPKMAEGPLAPPDGARTLAVESWGGGRGTFWQLGATAGMIWDQVPDCWRAWAMRGKDVRPPPSASWTFAGEDVARGYFDAMASSYAR